MKRSHAQPEEPLLFDLPLAPQPPASEVQPAVAAEPEPLLFEAPRPGSDAVEEAAAPTPARQLDPAPIRARLLAAIVDLGVVAAVLVVAWSGARLLEVRPGTQAWPAFLTLGLIFSFVYQTVPLAFWGRTPGMARCGLSARALSGERPTFYQALGRWLGWLITIGLAALPGLLALTGRSLVDRLSRTSTLTSPRA
jgi:uncharacterized RDD family membrane protein YckC